MKNNEKHIKKRASETLDAMISHQPLQASDEFFMKVEEKLNRSSEANSFPFMEWMKYAALIAIMLLNGVLLFSVLQETEIQSDDYSTVIDDYFPQYQTLSEDLE